LAYALFLGCVIPVREPSYELSVRKVFTGLGVDLVDLNGATCCAPVPIESLDPKTSLTMAAFNLCIAEEAGLDLMTICNGCFETLSKANSILKEDAELKSYVNTVLANVGKEYKGRLAVKNYLQVLHGVVGLDKIKKAITSPLDGLNVAAFYGCHLLKPSSILKFDDPESPHVLDEMIEITGARSIPYLNKIRCCGGLLRGVQDDLASKLARDKIFNVSQAQADAVITTCPFCFLQFDLGQLEFRRRFNETYEIPVLHYPELLGLAMGITPNELGLHTHRVSTQNLTRKVVRPKTSVDSNMLGERSVS